MPLPVKMTMVYYSPNLPLFLFGLFLNKVRIQRGRITRENSAHPDYRPSAAQRHHGLPEMFRLPDFLPVGLQNLLYRIEPGLPADFPGLKARVLFLPLLADRFGGDNRRNSEDNDARYADSFV